MMTPATQIPPRRRILRLTQVKEITGLGKTSIWRRVTGGTFPKPVLLGGDGSKAVGWREADINEWFDSLQPAPKEGGQC